MSTTYEFGQKATVGAQLDEQTDVADEGSWNPQPSVEQEIQARIDYADDRAFEGRLFGQTLADEERMAAREWEIERTRVRWDRSQTSDREARCRADVRSRTVANHVEFAERRASVDPWADPAAPDPRDQLDPDALGRVNRAAKRISERLGDVTPAAVSRLVAERAVETGDVETAALATYERLAVDPGRVVPIGRIGEVQSREVSVEGRVLTLWDPSHPTIAQVGLL